MAWRIDCLRAHWQEAGLPQGFQILDSDDQLRLVKRIIREMNLDDSKWPPRQAQWFINKQKDEGLRADHLDHGGDPYQRQMIAIYREYEAACQRAGSVDFAELLLRAHELWRDRPDLLQHYRERFGAVLVDEFQDTNSIQYAWLRLLAGEHGQAVRGRRRRPVDLRLARCPGREHPGFPEPLSECPGGAAGTELSLDRQYPHGANAVIANNPTRLGKQLWTEDGDGEPIRVYGAFNEVDEARFVIDRIRTAIEHGSRRTEMRHPVSHHGAVAAVRGVAVAGRDPVPRLWRPALLRAGRDQGCPGLSAADVQSS